MRPVAAVEAVLPLHHHAQVLVVQQQHLDRQLLRVRRRQLLHVHQERAVAINVDHLAVGKGHFGPERRGIAVAHRSQTSAGQELARVFEFIVLRCPHLVLTHTRRQDRVALR